MAKPRREHLLDVAEQLFYRNGFHATGIDAIQAASGVAKTTMYKHFRSKEALILAMLARASERVRGELERLTAPAKGQGVARLQRVFEDLDQRCNDDDFNGCLFNNAAAEFLHLDQGIRDLAVEHMAWMRDFFHRLLSEEGLPNDRTGLLLALYEGILVIARVEQRREIVSDIQQQLPSLLSLTT